MDVSTFQLKPALGRLFTEEEDRQPGAGRYVVLSYDYWNRRFGWDPHVVGRTVSIGDILYEIVGVSEQKFTGTEPGTVIDIFIPSFEKASDGGTPDHLVVVGVARDAYYSSIHIPMLPVVFVPFQGRDKQRALHPVDEGTFIVRTSSTNPLAMASTLRREVSHASPAFYVSTARTQLELNQAQTIRERLLATLAFFFGAVALLLAGVGLYGVLSYSVQQQEREIGIRMALGAQLAHVIRQVIAGISLAVILGACAGLALGLASERYIQSLLYQVSATELAVLALPWLMILVVLCIAAVPAILRAKHVDPVTLLRAD